jgi:hypothetical protein
MKEKQSVRSVSKQALRAVGKGAVKTAQLAVQEIGAYQQRQEHRRRAEEDTRLARAAMELGGFVDSLPGGIVINDREIFERHEMTRVVSSMNSAISLALNAVENSPVEQVGDQAISESQSFRLTEDARTTTLQSKFTDAYSFTYMKNFEEWSLSPKPIFDPNTGKTLRMFYSETADYEAYDLAGKHIESGMRQYGSSDGSPTERYAFSFETAYSLVNRATREVAQAAYDNLTVQGEDIAGKNLELYNSAMYRQPAIYYDAQTNLFPVAFRELDPK